MASLEEQFEQAFTEITVPGGPHLLEADAITDCEVSGSLATVTLNLPKDAAVRQKVSDQVRARLSRIPGITTVKVKMHDELPEEARAIGTHAHQAGPQSQPRQAQRPQKKVYLQNYNAVIAVGSGKGGVGKSTVAVNLAVTLANMGYKTSLFDADIYGPSLPIMMGLRNTKPKMEDERTLIPLKKYGLDCMSIGNLVEEAAATIWRGPIVHQVIEQMLRDTKWPGGDFMIIDLPPGTGDAQLSLSQLLELAGSVIVSTPQDVALLDAIKAVSMFQKVDVPVIGLVENMSAFICPKCGTETPIFDKGNAQRAAGQNNIPFLGRIPIEIAIREGGDMGAPVCATQMNGATAKAFQTIAESMIKQLEQMG
ncbi:MAG TPA: Mrp/NBP35 family ATP-binding protein [bacterium]